MMPFLWHFFEEGNVLDDYQCFGGMKQCWEDVVHFSKLNFTFVKELFLMISFYFLVPLIA